MKGNWKPKRHYKAIKGTKEKPFKKAHTAIRHCVKIIVEHARLQPMWRIQNSKQTAVNGPGPKEYSQQHSACIKLKDQVKQRMQGQRNNVEIAISLNTTNWHAK